MKDIFVVIGYFCLTGLLTFCGILMLIASDKTLSILYNFLRLSQVPQQTRSWNFWSRTQWRVGGILTTAASIYMMTLPIKWILRPSSEQNIQKSVVGVTGHWTTVALLIIVFLAGTLLAVNPRCIIEPGRLFASTRIIRHEGTRNGLVVVRMIGIGFLIFSLYETFVAFK